MAYVTNADFKPYIQTDNLNQIINNDQSILGTLRDKATERALSELRQKYDTSNEVTETTVWDFTKTYAAQQIKQINAPAYNPLLTYAINTRVLQAGNVYQCITPITVPEAFNAAHWLLIGAQYQTVNTRVYLDAPPYNATSGTYLLNSLTLQTGIVYINTTPVTTAEAFNATKWAALGTQYQLFYVIPPAPLFDINKPYNINDKVFWNNSIYTSAIRTSPMGHVSDIQYNQISNRPPVNIFPNDTVNGTQYWGNAAPYFITPGTLPTNNQYWAMGDNRSKMLVGSIIDIAIYYMLKRIAPLNIPEQRRHAYNEAIAWLELARDGKVNADLPLLQPRAGGRIRFGGQIKLQNNY